MKKFTIVRVAIREEGAFGIFLCKGIPFGVTLERTYDPDNDVKIPPGRYICSRTLFFRGGYETYEVPVPGHSRLLFHKGNVETDSEGCPIVAKSFGMFGGIPGVASSRIGFNEFMALANGAPEIELKVDNWERRDDS